jgi:hypothetical protein
MLQVINTKRCHECNWLYMEHIFNVEVHSCYFYPCMWLCPVIIQQSASGASGVSDSRFGLCSASFRVAAACFLGAARARIRRRLVSRVERAGVVRAILSRVSIGARIGALGRRHDERTPNSPTRGANQIRTPIDVGRSQGRSAEGHRMECREQQPHTPVPLLHALGRRGSCTRTQREEREPERGEASELRKLRRSSVGAQHTRHRDPQTGVNWTVSESDVSSPGADPSAAFLCRRTVSVLRSIRLPDPNSHSFPAAR